MPTILASSSSSSRMVAAVEGRLGAVGSAASGVLSSAEIITITIMVLDSSKADRSKACGEECRRGAARLHSSRQVCRPVGLRTEITTIVSRPHLLPRKDMECCRRLVIG